MWNTIFLRSLQSQQQRLAAAAVATAASGFLTAGGNDNDGEYDDDNNNNTLAFYPRHYTLAEKSNSNSSSSSRKLSTSPRKHDIDDEEEEDDDFDHFDEEEEDEDEEHYHGDGEDDDEDEELPPWWGTRLTRRLTRHFTRQTVRGIPAPEGGGGGNDANNTIPTDDGSQQSPPSGSPSSSSPAVDESTLFHGQCLKRQMRVPVVPYPGWDYDWDGRMTEATNLEGHRNGTASSANSKNKTRHIILVRHGQYNEYPKDDINRKLTPLGRRQAILTGRRLAKIANGSTRFKDVATRGPCPVKVIRVSDMRRARETAELIAREMKKHAPNSNVILTNPDEELNEALPAPMLPIRPELSWATEEIDIHKDRVERTFQKYFYRDDKGSKKLEREKAEAERKEKGKDGDDEEEKTTTSTKAETEEEEEEEDDGEYDEFEIIVCHGNMIRYLFCRALQLPPEVWLRLSLFNCSLTYLMIRPNGMVTARMLGDIGHLDYEETTFSSNYGFKW